MEEEREAGDNGMREFVQNKTMNIAEKVEKLQLAFGEYIEAEQVRLRGFCYGQVVKKSLVEQKQLVDDNGCFDRVNEIMNEMTAYSVRECSLFVRE